MEWSTLLQVFLFGIALSMDAFAVSIVDSLVYQDIKKKHAFIIAGLFGLMQALMPLIGYWIVELVTVIADESTAHKSGHIMSIVVTWFAFALLVLIGTKFIANAIRSLQNHEDDEKQEVRLFSLKEVFMMSIATAIDALAVGVSLHAGISSNSTIWLHVTVIMIVTFAICIVGVLLGKKISVLLKGKHDLTGLVAGIILILLAVWIVCSFYLGI